MKKLAILLALFALSMGAFSCGGGAGSSNDPLGENPGVPSVVQLSPSHYIAQTNANITLHAKVLDGNGVPLKGVTVTFTNLSEPFGVLKPLAATTAVTNNLGIASMNLSSTTPGFATILAQVNTGVGIVRDQKSVFFTSNDVLAVRMALDVDADNDLIYDEASDILLGETPTDTSVKIRARVYNAGGVLLAGAQVRIAAERAYRVGNSVIGTGSICSDGSTTCWIAFPLGNTALTNENGEAVFQMVVGAESLRDFTTNLNIFAQAGNGAANMKTLFISPVTVSSITVIANPAVLSPSTLDSPKTSTITATALTNFNQFVPNGTAVNFSIDAACAAAGGKITPFARTTNGTAEATFTAPSALMTCNITASIGSVSATTSVLVTTALTVFPASATIAVGGTATFTIFGGVPPYAILSSNTAVATVAPASVPASGGTFTVTGVSAGTATIRVTDNVGTVVTVSVTVTAPTPDFTIICAPTNVNGGVGVSTCTITSVNGYVGVVALSCNPADPTGTGSSCAFVPALLVPTGTSNLTLTCGGAGGPLPFNIVATDGTITKNQPMVATCP